MEKRLNTSAQLLILLALLTIPLVYPFSFSDINHARAYKVYSYLPIPKTLSDFLFSEIEPYLRFLHSPLAIKETLSMQIFLLIGLIWLAMRFFYINDVRSFKIHHIPLFLLILYAGLSILWSNVIYASFNDFIRLALYSLFFFAVCDIKKDKKFFSKVVFLYYIVSLILIIIAIMQNYNITLGMIIHEDTLRNRVGSFIGHNTGLSIYLIPTYFLSIAYLFLNISKTKKILISLFLYLELFVIIVAQSRSAWLIIFFLTPIFVYLIIKKTKYRITKSTVKTLSIQAIIILLILISQLTPTKLNRNQISLVKRLKQYSPTTLITGTRIRIMVCSMQMIKEKPLFGRGIGTFEYEYPKYQRDYFVKHPVTVIVPTDLRSQQAHNDYLQLIIELGFVGFIIAISGLIYYIRKGFLNFRQTSDNTTWVFQLTVLIIIISHLIQAYLDFPIRIAPLSINFIFFLGLWVSGRKTWELNQDVSEKEISVNALNAPPSLLRGIKLGVFGASIVIACLISHYIFSQFISDIYFCKTDTYLRILRNNPDIDKEKREKALNLAKINIDKALYTEPYNMMYKFYQGLVSYQRKEYDKAINEFMQTLTGYRYHQVFFYIAEVFNKKGDINKAIEYYKTSIYYSPAYVEAYHILSEIYVSLKKPELINYYRGLIYKYNRQYFDDNFASLGYVAFDRGEYDKAIAILKNLSSAVPEEVEYPKNIAMAYLKSGDLEKTKEIAEKIIEIYPEEPEGYSILSQTNAIKKNYIKTIEYSSLAYKKALSKNKKGEMLNSNVIKEYALRKTGRDKEAKELYDSEIVTYPNKIERLLDTAMIYSDILEEREQSIEFMKELVNEEIDVPTVAHFYYLIAKNYYELGNFKESREYIEKAFKINPELDPAKLLLEDIEKSEK